MSVRVELYSADGSHVDSSFEGWLEALAVAQNRGWMPAGASVKGLGRYWSGGYLPQPGCCPLIEAEDATALAQALDSSLAAGDFYAQNMHEKRQIVEVCQRGPVLVFFVDDSAIFCQGCEQDDPTAFEHLCAADKLPWSPSPGFDPFLAFREVRQQLTGCCALASSTRFALAQAICGHLAARPQDAAMTDAQLLGAVEQTFFSGFWLPWERDTAAAALLRQARQRRSWGEDAVPLPELATTGPWWRAASILADAGTALAAAGVEWLYRHPGQPLPSTPLPGYSPASSGKLDADRIQRDIWGGDLELWPTTYLRCNDEDWQLTRDDRGDIDAWPELTGLSLEELLEFSRR